jgi:hypothetical protein
VIKNKLKKTQTIRIFVLYPTIFLIGFALKESVFSFMLLVIFHAFRFEFLTIARLIVSFFVAKNILVAIGLSDSNRDLSSLFELIVVFVVIYGIDLNNIELQKNEYDPTFLREFRWIISAISALTAYPLLKSLSSSLSSYFTGYDNVGHFAMWRMWSECQTYFTICSEAKSNLPKAYIDYPSQWHLLFSVRSNYDLRFDLISFGLASIITGILACQICIGIARTYVWDKLSVEKCSRDNVLIYSRIVSAFLVCVILFVWLSGYPNFLFSISMMVLGIFYVINNKYKAFILGLFLISIAGYTYTLFLLSASIIVLFISIREIKSPRSKWIIFQLVCINIFNLILSLRFLFNSFTNEQFNALQEQSKTTILVVIWLIFIPILFYRNKNSVNSNLLLINYILYISAFCLQSILFLRNTSGGYFMFKFWLMLIVITIVFYIPPIQANRWKILGWEIVKPNLFVVISTIIILSNFLSFAPSSNLLRNLVYKTSLISSQGNNVAEKLIFLKSITNKDDKATLVISKSYFSDTQWLAAINGKWTENLQRAIVELAVFQSETGEPISIGKFREVAKKYDLNFIVGTRDVMN